VIVSFFVVSEKKLFSRIFAMQSIINEYYHISVRISNISNLLVEYDGSTFYVTCQLASNITTKPKIYLNLPLKKVS